MHICLYLNPRRCLRWHRWLADALFLRPNCVVFFAYSATSHPLPLSCDLTLELERLVYGHPTDHAVDRIDAPDEDVLCGRCKPASFDVVVDLVCDGGTLPPCGRVLTPVFNSVPGDIGALAALISDQAVLIEIHDSARTRTPLCARPALADPRVLLSALDGVLSRTTDLILKAVHEPRDANDVAVGPPVPKRDSSHPPVLPGSIARAVRVLGEKVIARIGRLVSGGNSWSIAYRLNGHRSLLADRRARFLPLSDDGRRYYADPFPFRYQGQFFIFVEEFPFATKRGCISVAEVAKNGSISRPRVVIEEAYHLSYPFVFEHDGHIWMVPESGQANRIDLYRAEGFPYRWKREGSLVEGIAAYDATLLRRNGRLWIFAGTQRWRSTSWDSLSIFHSTWLAGPWVRHLQNPVLIDATCSRPAGAPLKHDADIILPVQDCSRIYGGGIILSRVDALSESTFRSTAIGRIECGTPGCHTYNRYGGLEVIDVFDAPRRMREVTACYTPTIQGPDRFGSAAEANVPYHTTT